MDLPITTNSFYDIPKINPKGSDTEPEGPVRDIPGRVHTTPSDMTTLKEMVAAKNQVKDAPENDPRSWNSGGDGNWWSTFKGLGTKGKKPING